MEDVKNISGDMKESNDSFKAKINMVEDQIHKLQKEIYTKQEERLVDCEWTYDEDKQKMILTRLDTNEKIQERDPYPDELQVKMELD